jgi:transposase InsO family protein
LNQKLYAKIKDSARYCRDPEIKKKVFLFLEVLRRGEVLNTCQRFGCSVSTYYFWWQRFRDSGFELSSLVPRSRRPKRSPKQISENIIRKIRRYRFQFRYGPKRIAFCLKVNHQLEVSESTIRRTIERKGWVLRKYRTKKKNPHRKRYSLPYPGHLQVDIKYVPEKFRGEQWYVYNAIDDCSRWRFAKVYRRISADNSVDFLKDLVRAAPFKILSIQTDNDVAFTNRLIPFWKGWTTHIFDIALNAHGIEHRLIPPGIKELNGKVERSHRTDDEEFYWKTPLECFEVFQNNLARWIDAYNYFRPHSSLQGKTPAQVLLEKILTPLLVLALKSGSIIDLDGKRIVKRTILDTYLIYLHWIDFDPFHSQDVMNYYRRCREFCRESRHIGR